MNAPTPKLERVDSNGRNGKSLRNLGLIVAAVAALISVFTFAESRFGRSAVLCAQVEAQQTQLLDHEARLRRLEEFIQEMRPVLRAVARKLNVDLDTP